MALADFPIVSLLIAVPLLGFLFVILSRGDSAGLPGNARALAYWSSGNVLILAIALAFAFDGASGEFQFVEEYQWFAPFGFTYRVGVDGISIAFILLTALLTPLCLLASVSITHRVREYVAAFLLLEAFVIGAFTSLDLVLFYLFFEGVLLPMFLIIGVWGGPRRNAAAFKFFLYTLGGSLFMLIGIFVLYRETGDTNIIALLDTPLARSWQIFLWLAFFASFAVKTPMWPLHSWLPAAHVEAPTAGSVMLAGVLLKLGAYGFLRFSLPMFPLASDLFAPFVFMLSLIAIIYTSLVAFAQTDIKRTIAYASIAHMGYATLGMFTATRQGVEGALFQMLSHGLVSAALFLCVGVLYDRLRSRESADFGGVVAVMPRFAALFMLVTLAAIGLPGTSGFVGEFLTLAGAWRYSPWLAAVAALGIVLSAVYMLTLYRRVMFGAPNADNARSIKAFRDLTAAEQATLIPCAALILLLGLLPSFALDLMRGAASALLSRYHQAVALLTPALPP